MKKIKVMENKSVAAKSELVEKVASIINDRRERITMINDDTLRDNGVRNVPSFRATIAKLVESGCYVVRVYMTAYGEPFVVEFKWKRWSASAVMDFAEYILAIISKIASPELGTAEVAEAVPAEVAAPTEYEVNYMSCANRINSEIKSVVFKSKDNADKFIAIMKDEGYEIVKWDINSYMGDPQTEDYEEAAPAEVVAEAAPQSENNLAYEDDIYTYNVGDGKSADYETIDELVKWAKKFPYEWFKVNNNDRLSFQFKRETYDDGGHQYRLYMHDNYGVLGDNNWYICNRMTYNNEYKLMGKIMDCMRKANDNMPQTDDFYFKTEEYKKAEAEAVKALPF